MVNGNGGESSAGALWKAATLVLAAFLSGVVISGGSYVLRSPSRGEVDLIRSRQDDVLQRLGIVEERVETQMTEIAELHERIRELERINTDSNILP